MSSTSPETMLLKCVKGLSKKLATWLTVEIVSTTSYTSPEAMLKRCEKPLSKKSVTWEIRETVTTTSSTLPEAMLLKWGSNSRGNSKIWLTTGIASIMNYSLLEAMRKKRDWHLRKRSDKLKMKEISFIMINLLSNLMPPREKKSGMPNGLS